MSKWSIPIDRLAEKIGADIDTVTRKATLDLFAAVVKRSPVDTGRFRANWNVSYGEPNVSTSNGTSESVVMAELSKVPTLPVGGVVYLANGLPYARRLEYGWSKQAPSGMVRISAMEFSEYVAKAVEK